MENVDIEEAVSSPALNGLNEAENEAPLSADETAPQTAPPSTSLENEDGALAVESALGKEEGEQPLSSNASESRGVSPVQTTAPSTAPTTQPAKRFNAVNINKKFLASSSTGTSAGHAPSSSSSRASSVAARPTVQTTQSHSRLVTAKLTAAPLSTSPGPGWSRPSSATPPVAQPGAPGPSSVSSSTSAPPLAAQTSSQGSSLGKLVQPQSRNALKPKLDGSGAPGKLAWRNMPATSANDSTGVSRDFPTAAEVAQGRYLQMEEMKAAANVVAAQKQAMSETADTFRGVHLDPNAHHWDDEEDDDNDYLGQVIEFGDGTQYTIQVNDGDKAVPAALGGQEAGSQPDSEVPVRKEDRFADDFDRSWPNPAHQQMHGGRADGGRSMSSFSETSSTMSTSPISMRDAAQARVLFNERSNRMEPASGGRPGASVGPHPQVLGRRNGIPDGPGQLSATGGRLERDLPPHSHRAPPTVQVLQKPTGPAPGRRVSHGQEDDVPPIRREGDGFDSRSTVSRSSAESSQDVRKGGRDAPAATSALGLPTVNGRRASSRERPTDAVNEVAQAGTSSSAETGNVWARRAASQNLSQPSAVVASKGMERQLPPHLSQFPPPIASTAQSQRRPSIVDPPPPPRREPPGPVVVATSVAPAQSPPPPAPPALHVIAAEQSLAPESVVVAPIVEPAPAIADVVDVEALQKAFLQDSAERAKKRRQQEEEERQKAQERARKKAAELEAKFGGGSSSTQRRGGEAAKVPPPVVLEASKLSGPSGVNAEAVQTDEDVKSVEGDVKTLQNTNFGADKPNIVPQRATEMAATRPTWGRTPSGREVDRRGAGPSGPPGPPVSVIPLRRPSHTTVAVSDTADTWRSKNVAPPQPIHEATIATAGSSGRSHAEAAPTITSPITSTLPSAPTFDVHAGEDLEVVDFSDLGRLVGAEVPSAEPVTAPPTVETKFRPSRPVASDFFRTTDDQSNAEQESWRRFAPPRTTLPQEGGDLKFDVPGIPSVASKASEQMPVRAGPVATAAVAQTPTKSPEATSSPSLPSQHSYNTSPIMAPRFLGNPPASPYRQAPLSTFEDTLSRIKGALDGMQSSKQSGASKTDGKDAGYASGSPSATPASQKFLLPSAGPSLAKDRWAPPAVHTSVEPHDSTPAERFESTRPEPPSSPLPSGRDVHVCLPKTSRKLDPVPKKQLAYVKFKPFPVRWDVMSWEPPVGTMNKFTFSLNDVLFRKPQGFKGKQKYRVYLPKDNRIFHRVLQTSTLALNLQSTPKVNIPGGFASQAKHNAAGAFGRPRMTDQDNWRPKPRTVSHDANVEVDRFVSSELDVTSRSPPPEPSSAVAKDATLVGPGPLQAAETAKAKIPQKMVNGVDVAFYRDVRKDAQSAESLSKVTFLVTSELEADAEAAAMRRETAQTVDVVYSSPQAASSEMSADHRVPDTPERAKSKVVEHAKLNSNVQSPQKGSMSILPDPEGGRGSQQTNHAATFSDKLPATPPSQTSSLPWVKSPARVPDPEHLKAVWSQASNKESLPTQNSLKEIADDLTTVPFSIHEVKSDDGGTPPPAGPTAGPVAPPSRMSASDVTRAFQTVPTPANSLTPSSSRSNPFSSTTSSPIGMPKVLKPPSAGYPQPPYNHGPRPHYMGYPSPMVSHTPSPTLVYSHVMPNGVQQGATGHYGQPVWMPMHGQAPPMRPHPSSPYSPSMMPYHVASGQNGMYPPPAHPSSPAPFSGPGGSQILVSPVMPHAAPVPGHMGMYGASPVMLAVPPPGAAPPPQPYPGVVGMGRGAVPVRPPMDPRHQQPPSTQTVPNGRFPPHNPGYSHVPPQSFVRPTW